MAKIINYLIVIERQEEEKSVNQLLLLEIEMQQKNGCDKII